MTQRLYILWSHPLFREFVHLLLDDPAVEIVGMASDYAAASVEMDALKPEIIIVEETDDVSVGSIDAVEVLKACTWEPRVVRLSLHDNELWVYSERRWTIESSEQILRLIQTI